MDELLDRWNEERLRLASASLCLGHHITTCQHRWQRGVLNCCQVGEAQHVGQRPLRLRRERQRGEGHIGKVCWSPLLRLRLVVLLLGRGYGSGCLSSVVLHTLLLLLLVGWHRCISLRPEGTGQWPAVLLLRLMELHLQTSGETAISKASRLALERIPPSRASNMSGRPLLCMPHTC